MKQSKEDATEVALAALLDVLASMLVRLKLPLRDWRKLRERLSSKQPQKAHVCEVPGDRTSLELLLDGSK